MIEQFNFDIRLIYQLIEFNADPTVIDKLEVNFRRDERVIRFLTFKMDKYAAEYAAKSFSSLWARCFSSSANIFFAEGEAITAFPVGIR